MDRRRLRPPGLTIDEARSWATVGVFSALALALCYVETFIPIPVPIPGVKPGLANAVVLTSLVVLDCRSACCVAAIKVLAIGFLFGSPIMIAYSAVGTLFATLAMSVLVKIPHLHMVPVAVVGAMLHNVGQLMVANVMLQTTLVWMSAPIMLVAACATGAITGLLAQHLVSIARAEIG